MYNILHFISSSESPMSASSRLNSHDDRILDCFRFFNPYALRHTYSTSNVDLSNQLERLATILWSMINSNPRNDALIALLERTGAAEEYFYSMHYRHQGSHYADRRQEISEISPVYDTNSREITLNGFQQRVRLWLFESDDNISDSAHHASSLHQSRCHELNYVAVQRIQQLIPITTPSTPVLRG